MTNSKPLPVPNSDSKPFWDACARHELRFQKCAACSLVRWPPSFICPQCHSFEAEWTRSQGKGKVISYVVYHREFHPAFKAELPYVTAIVELDEGARMLTNIIGCPSTDVRCDMPVELVWEDISEEFSLPKFRSIKPA